jgi:predicted RNA binding protein YcfA (HicA-like mRNA interferase family)
MGRAAAPSRGLQPKNSVNSASSVRERICGNNRRNRLKFSELVKLLEGDGFRIVKQKGSIRYYGKPGWDRLIRLDYHGAKEVPTGTCHSILKAAGIS